MGGGGGRTGRLARLQAADALRRHVRGRTDPGSRRVQRIHLPIGAKGALKIAGGEFRAFNDNERHVMIQALSACTVTQSR